MKTKYLVFSLLTMAILVGCSDNYLTREPYSSTITQAQYEQLSGTLEASMRGVYSRLYYVSDHDEFGKRSIDMYTDLTSSDMALTGQRYGWFTYDEAGMAYTSRTSYIWTLYYQTMRNINKVISTITTTTDLTTRVATYGVPNTYNKTKGMYYTIVNADTLAKYTEAEANTANIYAQALTMRAYFYSSLINLYTYPVWRIFSMGGDLNSTVAFPIYNESNLNEAQALSSVADAYTQVESDLENAIAYFSAFSNSYSRGSKLEVDINVARGILAYSYLNKGNQNAPKMSTAYREPYENALRYAKDVMESGAYSILPNKDVLTNGFNDVNSANWMWGQDVTIETTGGLASFFGQVDIHSYSYAWSGDTKAIDENLYKLIPDFDVRKQWFNDGTVKSGFKYAPDKKFFSSKNPNSTEDVDIDREWLSDNVFMRYESMFLIAAEAAFRLGDYDNAKSYLTAITNERVADGRQTEYSAYAATLNSQSLLNEIEYNWRVEMWGEGYGLQTLLRLGNETITAENKRRRGGNHCQNAGSEIDATSGTYTFVIPSSETSYNPAIKGTTMD